MEMSDNLLHVSDAEFEDQVLKSEVPVLVDFWAPWCGPCRMISPIIEELADEYDGKVRFAKVNTDENPQVPGQYQIMSIPSLLLFKDGELVDRAVGMRPKPALKSWIDGVL
jgi:thioredoxin 1